MIEKHSVTCSAEGGTIGLLDLTLKTGSEMLSALETLPHTNLPKGYNPTTLAEFDAPDKTFREGGVVIVQYEKRGNLAYASHYFWDDSSYEREEINGNLRLFLGKCVDFAGGVDVNRTDSLPMHDKYMGKTRRVQRFMFDGNPEGL